MVRTKFAGLSQTLRTKRRVGQTRRGGGTHEVNLWLGVDTGRINFARFARRTLRADFTIGVLTPNRTDTAGSTDNTGRAGRACSTGRRLLAWDPLGAWRSVPETFKMPP